MMVPNYTLFEIQSRVLYCYMIQREKTTILISRSFQFYERVRKEPLLSLARKAL